MTKQDYRNALQEIIKEAERKKIKLLMRYAHNNAKYKTSDIVKTDRLIIKIEKILPGYSFRTTNPAVWYYGSVLTKKLQPRKDGEKVRVEQNRIISTVEGQHERK